MREILQPVAKFGNRIKDFKGKTGFTFCCTERRIRYHKRCRKATTFMVDKILSVSARLSELRGNDSVSAFARKVGINQQTMDTYFKGRLPPLEICARISTIFDVSIDWIAGLSDVRGGVSSVGGDAEKVEMANKIHDLEIKVATLENALSLVGGRRAPSARTGGSSATKTA